MSKFMTLLEEKVAPVVNKIGSQRHLRAVRNGIISMLPLTIVGSFFVIFLNVPIPGYEELIAPIKASLDIPFRYTVAKSITLLSVDTTLPDSNVRGCAKREAE